jgi:hypothetical protein
MDGSESITLKVSVPLGMLCLSLRIHQEHLNLTDVEGKRMEQFNWAQAQIDELTGTTQKDRHEAQRSAYYDQPSWESRAQRRSRERQEQKAAKKAKA